MNIIISVTGLGYVGLPLAIEFAKKYKVIGFDQNNARISELKKGYDRTKEISRDELGATKILFTSNSQDLKNANFHIIAVPTPVNNANQPDMAHVLGASKSVGAILKPKDIVVYESTVYPGATEEDCAPILESASGLRCGVDFKIGYSPERINPSDKQHTLTTIIKVVSGQDHEALETISAVYGSIVKAGIYKAESIKIAEAAKVIENTQRDLNIAFVNELSLIFKKMDIDTKAVLKAAGTKWNFLNFTPGLVGGHCIGVDPFYLTYKSEKLGYHPQVILAGRRINDNMGTFVAQQTIENLIAQGVIVKKATVNLLGLTFKENCPDVRNTKVKDIFKELRRLQIKVHLHDPIALKDDIYHEYGQAPEAWEELKPADAVILAAPHQEIIKKLKDNHNELFKKPEIFMDVKGIFEKDFFQHPDSKYWRL